MGQSLVEQMGRHRFCMQKQVIVEGMYSLDYADISIKMKVVDHRIIEDTETLVSIHVNPICRPS